MDWKMMREKKSRSRKLFRKWCLKFHAWLALPLGLVITLTCFSGAMLVFEQEVNQVVFAHLYRVDQPAFVRLSDEVLKEKVAATLPAGVKVVRLVKPTAPDRTYEAKLSQPRHATLFVDPYTGEVKGSHERLPFFQTMFRLHRWLLDSKPADGGIYWGKLCVGISTLLFVGALLTGLLSWWPRNRTYLKESLRIPVRRGLRRWLYGLHVTGGVYAVVFLLLMALTGLTWSFPWYRTAFYELFGLSFPEGKGLVYALHVGSWGGWVTRILYFITALIGMTLPLTGYYLWWRKRKRS
ncbi:hypothetical protein, membrane [gut metagenome]|uniref:PepSY domain-containing protein n=1 Tax=gut metagenome TaxID=749906 RepID=J9FVP5_9ZZZZ